MAIMADSPTALRCPSCGADALNEEDQTARCVFCGASLRPAGTAEAEVPRVAMILAGMAIGAATGAGLGYFVGVNAWISAIVGVVVGAVVGAFTDSSLS